MSGNQEPKSVDITEEAIASGAEVSAALQKIDRTQADPSAGVKSMCAACMRASKTPVLSE